MIKRHDAKCAGVNGCWRHMDVYLAADMCYAYKILLVPSSINSHVRLFSRLSIDLTNLGHSTTVLATSNSRVPEFASDSVENFTYIQYPVAQPMPFANTPDVSEKMVELTTTTFLFRHVKMIEELCEELYGEQDCTRLLDNVEVMQMVRGTEFDFAIMDLFSGIACYYTIP